MADLELIKGLVMAQAKDKGWGTTPKDISVGEKVALLHSELSEALDAFFKKNYAGRHGVNEEFGDALSRALHLSGIFGINFNGMKDQEFEELERKPFEIQIVLLHKQISEFFENYRQGRMDDFISGLTSFVFALLAVMRENKINLDEAIQKKLQINKDRVWDKKKLNEKIV